MSHRSVLGTLSFLAMAALLAPSLQGCLLAAAGAGASAGYTLSQDRSVEQQLKDTALQAAVTTAWRQYEPKLYENCSANVYNGRVLITGRVPNEQWRQIADKLAWRQKGVIQVYDEVQVGPGEHFINSAQDGIISTKLKAALLGDGDIRSANYSITTVEGVVYLMGTARSQHELDDAISHARNTAGVKRVVSLVQFRGATPPARAASAGAPPPPPPAAPSGGAPPPPSAYSGGAPSPSPAAIPEGPPPSHQPVQVTPLQ